MKHIGREPEAAGIEQQGLGWTSSSAPERGGHDPSGLGVTWTSTPTKWSNNFFTNLFGYEWELTKSPAGAHQWKPKKGAGAGTMPDAHDPSKRHTPSMLTTDLSLRFDPVYEKIHGVSSRIPISSQMHSPGRGSSSRTAIWARCAAIWPRFLRKS